MRLLDKQLLSSWKKKKNIKEGKEGLGSIRDQTQKEIHKRIKAKVLLDTTCIYLKKMEHRQMYIYIYIHTHTHIYIYKYKYMWSMRDTAVSHNNCSAQFNHSVVCDSLVTPWIAAHQSSLSITNSWRSLRLMSIESVMPFSHLILCCPLLLLSPIPPSITVFSNESTLRMRWPKYWSFSFSTIPSKEISGLISFRMDWLDLPAVQGTLKSLLQHHSSKASILWRSAFFTVQLSHLYMTTGKTIALTRRTFVGKVMSLLLNMLSRLVITFLPRSKVF